MFYLHSLPGWMRMIFPKNVIWEGPVNTGHEVYLTFDDGPTPEVTPFVLDQLAKYQMKGSFFCIGSNVAKYPELYRRIIAEGHTIGNHTMEHVNGWETGTEQYLQDVVQAAAHIDARFFRPPYGKIKQQQAAAIRAKFPDMQIVMWSVVAGDFDESVDGHTCAAAVEKYSKPGSLIVYHDSEKAWDRLQVALPKTLAMLQQKGFTSCAL
ncbi:MAG TPA: polysaccharide deacetylase family protein [Phnomibacter sp.]|nr:polysaccharide deacetylase family protein [Phnomibacter sp.]